MSLVPRNTKIKCDCLQPRCPYCDKDGSIRKAHENLINKILKEKK